MNRFQGKTILITGGTSGIGLAGAAKLADEGADVIVTGRSTEHLARAAEVLGDRAMVVNDDQLAPESPQRLARVAREAGGLDGIWLNAGYAAASPIEDLTRSETESMFAVNTVAPMLQMGALSPMVRSGGSVLVTSSTATYEGGKDLSLYSATKAALLSAARCWATELSPRNIRVNTLVPGPITSNLRTGLPAEIRSTFESELADQVLLRRVGDAKEAAAFAAFLLSDDASFVTGSSHYVDGGLLLH